MAQNWKYYIPHNELYSATLVAHTGASTTLDNIKNVRRFSRCDVDSLGSYGGGSDDFVFRVDLGSQKTTNFVGLIQHNLYSETANLVVLNDQFDSSGFADPQNMLNSEAAVAGDATIWLEEADNERTKRYFWVHFDSISTNAYCGCLLLGAKLDPTPDPNYGPPYLIDIDSGRIINTTPGGVDWITRTSSARRAWDVSYELISTTHKDEIVTALTTNPDNPFIFTNDGGTTFYYGRIMGRVRETPMQAGLWNLEFTITEVIA